MLLHVSTTIYVNKMDMSLTTDCLGRNNPSPKTENSLHKHNMAKQIAMYSISVCVCVCVCVPIRGINQPLISVSR